MKISNYLREIGLFLYSNISLVSKGTLSILAIEYEHMSTREGRYTESKLLVILCFAINSHWQLYISLKIYTAIRY